MTGTHLTFLQQVKAALRTAEEFSRLINNQANSSQHAIPEFLLNFRVRALLSDQILAESLFPGRAPFLSAVSSPVKKAEDEYDAPAEQAQRPPGPPVAKFPLDDMYYTLEENHEDWVHNHEQLLHARVHSHRSRSAFAQSVTLLRRTALLLYNKWHHRPSRSSRRPRWPPRRSRQRPRRRRRPQRPRRAPRRWS